MAETLYSSGIASLTYIKENQMIEMVWLKNPDSDEYRAIFTEIVKLSEHEKIKYVLSDMRNQGLVVTEDVQWMNKEVLKKAEEHKLEKIALVIEDDIFSNVYSDVVKNKLKSSPVQVQVFMNILDARSWLQGNE